MKIKLITDSTSDLSQEFVNQNDLSVIPFIYQMNGVEYADDFGQSMPHEEFYSRLSRGETASTSQINPYQFEQYFETYLKQGYSVLYIAFSSGMSSTYQNAVVAQNTLRKKYPDLSIIAFDSKTACAPQEMIINEALRLMKLDFDIVSIANHLEAYKTTIGTYFIVDDLNHLARGGRISNTSAMLGYMMEVKPILTLNDGKIVSIAKVRGRKKALNELIERFKIESDPNKQTVYIHHSASEGDVELLKTRLMECENVSAVVVNPMGPIIGSHTGPRAVNIGYLRSNVNHG